MLDSQIVLGLATPCLEFKIFDVKSGCYLHLITSFQLLPGVKGCLHCGTNHTTSL